ncbi:amidohydrolase family protein [Pararobbsia silviterrae]|uniref:Amidohydrolase n=1 Tax=Pararobbsia silviterrae TaxID=1792498 RepID=A0A494Y7V0_9BURK|nr:amidohydrolase family protein [Pararobbsia silviterrae]RKP58446.1 amidohydrolase [Pararobbsia silviterrae]
MKIVDPHIHLWDLDTHHYPWLANPGVSFVGDARALKHNYLIADFLADADAAGSAHAPEAHAVADANAAATNPTASPERFELVKAVHIDANHDPADPVEETRWLQSVADGAASRGMPNAIVAGADLSADNVEAVLAAHAAFPNTRGIRQILNVHANPLYDYVGRHYMRESAWRRNFGLLRKYRLSFDLQLYPSQMPEAVELARENPHTPFIVNHAGMFVDRDTPLGWRAWRDGLRALAACENVAVKISGLAMFDHAWTVESLRPYVLETIDAFGVERAMFASNFPVDRLFGGYHALWSAYAAIVNGASAAEKEALFRRTAERVYRI